MHAREFLHNCLERSCPDMHAARREAVVSGVSGVMNGRRLSIAGVGRALPSGAKAKHRIKRIDRLVGNPHLALEHLDLYRAMAAPLVGTQPRPLILVDWSDAASDRSLQLLRASIVADGRSLTLYEEVHPLAHYDNRTVRAQFLARLKDCLPATCRPILIADAGFRVSWCQQVEAMGWDWITRVRGRVLYRRHDTGPWLPVTSLHEAARTTPAFVGHVELSRQGKHPCALYCVRLPSKGRVHRTLEGERRQDRRSRDCARQHQEPWVLATSLRDRSPAQVCKLYRCRTQIEGSFRDLKNAQWGIYLRAHRTRSAARLAVLVLLGTLATFTAYLVGVAATTMNLARDYQANTSRRRVLSYVYLGLEIIRDAKPNITLPRMRLALAELNSMIRCAAQ
jgi:hypothetical protein